MDISKFVSELKRSSSIDAAAVKSFAMGFYGRYIVEFEENNNILIRRKTDEQIEEEQKAAGQPNCMKHLAYKDKLNPFYFTKTADVMCFNIEQDKGKTIDELIAENNASTFADELKPILTNIFDAYKRTDSK
jgi:hypothetical protein